MSRWPFASASIGVSRVQCACAAVGAVAAELAAVTTGVRLLTEGRDAATAVALLTASALGVVGVAGMLAGGAVGYALDAARARLA